MSKINNQKKLNYYYKITIDGESTRMYDTKEGIKKVPKFKVNVYIEHNYLFTYEVLDFDLNFDLNDYSTIQTIEGRFYDNLRTREKKNYYKTVSQIDELININDITDPKLIEFYNRFD